MKNEANQVSIYRVDATYYLFLEQRDGWRPRVMRWRGVVTAGTKEEALNLSTPGGGTSGAKLMSHSVSRIGTAESGPETPWEARPGPVGGIILVRDVDCYLPTEWKEE